MNISDINWPGWNTTRLIGKGSFGAVYEIHRDHFGMEEEAALKVISIPQSESDIDELLSDGYDVSSITARYESYLKDIVGEYSMMAKMKGHSNIVYCDDLSYTQHEDGIGWDIYIKMELLTALPKALPQEIPEEMVISLGKDMCKALMVCKEQNIVHRDIKPQNIFVSKDGIYKLGDFGIAKTAERTTSGTKIGTYKYMAPEVYKSEPYGSAADIYSLGLVMYWLLNERRTPFLPLPPEVPTASMEDEARTRRFKGEQLSAPAHGSPELQAIVMKACAYDPKDRFSSAAEMLEAMNTLGTQDSIVPATEAVLAESALVSEEEKTAATVGAFSGRAERSAEEERVSAESAVSAFSVQVEKEIDEEDVPTESAAGGWNKEVEQAQQEATAGKSPKVKWGILAAIAVLVIAVITAIWPKHSYSFDIVPKISGPSYEYVIDSDIPDLNNAAIEWELRDVEINGIPARLLEIVQTDHGVMVEGSPTSSFALAASCRYKGVTYEDVLSQEEAPLQAIVIRENPSKTEYIKGETVDLSGLDVLLRYSNGEEKHATADDIENFTVSPKVLRLTGENREVSIKYGNQKAIFKVTVKEAENDSASAQNKTPEAAKPAVTTQPQKQTPEATQPQQQKPAATTTTSKKDQPVTLKSIKASAKLATYENQKDFKCSDFHVVATYSDGSTKTISDGFTFGQSCPTRTGTLTLHISYQGQIASTTITVVDPPVELERLFIKWPNGFEMLTNTTYYVGDTWRLSDIGAFVWAEFSDGTQKDVSGACALYPTTLAKVGNQELTASYQGMTTTVSTVYVKEKMEFIATVLTKITAVPQGTFCVGDSLSTNNVTVFAHYTTYSSGSEKTSAFEVETSDGVTFSPAVLTTAGAQTVTVSYQEETFSFTLDVKDEVQWAYGVYEEYNPDSTQGFSVVEGRFPEGFSAQYR